MMHYKKMLGALTILGALAAGGTAFAQTASTTTGASTTDTTTSVTTTPGAPNTGAGGNAEANYLMLGGSALIAAAGAAYLARKNAVA